MVRFALVLIVALGLVGQGRGLRAQDLPEYILEDVRDVFDAEEHIATPSGVEVADDGRLYVSDPLNHRILVLSPEGEFSHTIGREGEGPGEFTHVGTMIVSGDSVRVLDDRSRRVQIFCPDGEYVRSYRVPGMGTGGMFAAFLPDGQLAVPTLGFRSTFLIQMEDVTGTVVDSVGTVVTDPVEIMNFAEMRAEAEAGHVPESLRHWVLPIAGPDGSLWLLLHGDMTIRHYDPQGELRLELAFDVPEAEAMLDRFFERTAGMQDNFVASLDMAVAGRIVDDRLWLLLPSWREQPTRLLVFEDDGTLLHRIDVPEGTGTRDFALSPTRRTLYLAAREQARLLAVELPDEIATR